MKRRKRAIATPSRRCAARVPASSAALFLAFGSATGSAPSTIVPPAASTSRATASAEPLRVVEHLSLRFAERRQPRRKNRAPRARRRRNSEPSRTALESFRPSMKSSGRPSACDQREGKREGRVRQVAAADVEEPGDRGRIGEDRRVGALLGDARCDLGDLLARPACRRAPRAARRPRRAAAPAGRARPRRADSARPARAPRRPPPGPWRSACTCARVISHGS